MARMFVMKEGQRLGTQYSVPSAWIADVRFAGLRRLVCDPATRSGRGS